MAIVARYQLGETTIIVHDDAYRGKTQEEIDAVIREAARVAERYTRIPKDYIPQNVDNEETGTY